MLWLTCENVRKQELTPLSASFGALKDSEGVWVVYQPLGGEEIPVTKGSQVSILMVFSTMSEFEKGVALSLP